MKCISVIYCYVFGGLIVIGASSAKLIDDHTVSSLKLCNFQTISKLQGANQVLFEDEREEKKKQILNRKWCP